MQLLCTSQSSAYSAVHTKSAKISNDFMFNLSLEICSTLIKGLELFLYTFVASVVEVKHGKIQNTPYMSYGN